MAPGWLVLAGFTYLDASILSSPKWGSRFTTAKLRRAKIYGFSAHLIIRQAHHRRRRRLLVQSCARPVVDSNGFRQEAPDIGKRLRFGAGTPHDRIPELTCSSTSTILPTAILRRSRRQPRHVSAGRSVRLSFIVQKLEEGSAID